MTAEGFLLCLQTPVSGVIMKPEMKERRSKQMRRPRILVVGSFVMDQIASTAVFPREGQTVLGESFSKAPGGKGANQAVQAARLGADVTMLGKLGRDANGQEMLRTMKEAGVDTSYVLYDEEKAFRLCRDHIGTDTRKGDKKQDHRDPRFQYDDHRGRSGFSEGRNPGI